MSPPECALMVHVLSINFTLLTQLTVPDIYTVDHQAVLNKTHFPHSFNCFFIGSRWNRSNYIKDSPLCFLPPSHLVLLLYTSCSIHHCWLILASLLTCMVGNSLLPGLLRAPLQPVMSPVCAQHRALPSCHRPLRVPVRLHWLSVQPRQVAFSDLFHCFTCCQTHSLRIFVFAIGK